MGAMLDSLHALQEVERKLAVIRSKAEQKKRQVHAHERTLKQHELRIEEIKKAVQECQIEIDRIDLDVQSRETDLNKHREALSKARTNKEYSAILTAINTEKADNTKLESRQLELMALIDQRKAELRDCESERDKVVGRVEKAKEGLEKYLADSADGSAKLKKRSAEIAEGLSPTILQSFQKIAERHEGEAMARVVVLNAKRDEYGCGGCNMSIRLQQAIGCKAGDDLVFCGSCGRILYYE